MSTLRRVILEINKVKAYLGFAVKSKKLIFGYDKLMEANTPPRFVMICSTQNEKVSNKVIKFCDDNKILVYKFKTYVLGELLHRNCKVIGIMDKNLAKAIISELKNTD